MAWLARDDRQCAGSDGIYQGQHPHPRGYGAFSRLAVLPGRRPRTGTSSSPATWPRTLLTPTACGIAGGCAGDGRRYLRDRSRRDH